ncbi:type II toxin-antitoxin system RelE family toxin [Hirschia litorea]|uniref:Type II toxin-antitoxin system RelE/ParE family toxin n=1 Tax=Hirschia litorea TaxID=1199156 RepID=A0ABW2IK80_9PROT
MTYKLEFHALALKEWKKLSPSIRDQLKKKLSERLENPCLPSARLSGSQNRYKIKLRSSGYRLVYAVDNDRIVVKVISVGKRERSEVYRKADKR